MIGKILIIILSGITSLINLTTNIYITKLFKTDHELDMYFKCLANPLMAIGIINSYFTFVVFSHVLRIHNNSNGWINNYSYQSRFGCEIFLVILVLIDFKINYKQLGVPGYLMISLLLWFNAFLNVRVQKNSSILNATGKSAFATLGMTISSIFSLLIIIMFSYIGIIVLAASQTILFLGCIIFYKFYNPSISHLRAMEGLNDNNFDRLDSILLSACMLFPFYLSSPIEAMFFGYLHPGELSCLSLAQKLMLAISNVFVISIINHMIVPSVRGEYKIQNAFIGTIAVSIALIMYILFSAKYIIATLYQNGKLELQQINMITSCFKMYSVGILPMAISAVIVKHIIYMKNQNALILYSLFWLLGYFATCFILSFTEISFPNILALSYSIAWIIFVLSWFFSQKEIPSLNILHILTHYWRKLRQVGYIALVLLLSTIAYMESNSLNYHISWSLLGQSVQLMLAITTIIFIISYSFIFIILRKIENN